MDHLHHQMGLSDRGAAGNGRTDRGGDHWIKEIDIQRDMQQAIGTFDAIQKGGQGFRDAVLVNLAHVMTVDPGCVQRGPFFGIDGSQAQNADPLLRDWMLHGRKAVKPRTTGHIGQRGAVKVSRSAGLRCVKICMSVEPKDELRSAQRGRVVSDARDAAQREGMIPAQKDRHAIMHRLFRSRDEPGGPSDRLMSRMRMIAVAIRRMIGDGEIAGIAHGMAEIAQRIGQARRAVGIWPHQTAGSALSAVNGCSDQNAGFRGHVGRARSIIGLHRYRDDLGCIKELRLIRMRQFCANWGIELDKTDERLVGALRQNARASLSELAIQLQMSRTTVRARIERLVKRGDILGFTVVMKEDVLTDPVRGLMMIGIEGRGTDRILRQLHGLTDVRAVHSTNGRWDLIVELGTETLEALDKVLNRIRQMDGVTTSETSLLLATRKSAGR